MTNWEWAEVAELNNLFSWDDVNTVCAEDGVTACAGTLEEKEFDGWIWATSDQVSELFVNATEDLTPAMLVNGLARVFDSPWAPQFLGLFTPTYEDSVSDWVIGWTADIDPDDATRVYTAFIKDVFLSARPTAARALLILQPLPPWATRLIRSSAVSGFIVLPRRQSSHPNRRPCCSWAAGSSSASDATGRTVHNGRVPPGRIGSLTSSFVPNEPGFRVMLRFPPGRPRSVWGSRIRGESMDNVTAMKSLYDAFGRGDIPSVLGAMSPDIKWHQAESNPYRPSGEAWVGPDAVLNNLFMRLGTEWEGFAVHPWAFHGAADSVIVEARYSGMYKPTGKKADVQVCHVWDVKDGKVTRFQQYVDTAKLHDLMRAG